MSNVVQKVLLPGIILYHTLNKDQTDETLCSQGFRQTLYLDNFPADFEHVVIKDTNDQNPRTSYSLILTWELNGMGHL